MAWYRHHVFAALICLLSILSPATDLSAAIRARRGTVVLVSGERFERVRIEVKQRFRVIRFFYEGDERIIGFQNIESILNSRGEDVTKDFLGEPKRIRNEPRLTLPNRAPPPTEETWLSETDPLITQTRIKRWQFALSAGSNYSFPVGSYYDGIQRGVGFGGHMVIAASYRFGVRLSLSKSGIDVDPDQVFHTPFPDLRVVDQTARMKAWRYELAVQYYYHPDRDGPDNSMFYFYSGAGAISHSVSGDLLVRDIVTSEEFIVPLDWSETKFLASTGLGWCQMLASNWGVDLGAHADLIFVGTKDTPGYTYYGANIQYALVFDLRLAAFAVF